MEIEGQELGTETGATEGSPSLESSESQNSEGQVQTQPSEQQPKQDTTPFHEHPRFKELVEQKNQALTEQKALRDQIARLESQYKEMSKPAPKQDKVDDLIEDLKKVDPRLAARIEAATKSTQTVEELRQELSTFKQRQAEQQAVATINQLHDTNKVSPELRSFINNEIDRQYMMGNIKNLEQIQAIYKSTHDTFKKFQEAIERTTTEKYVRSKAVDSKIPASQPKGTPAKPGPQKPKYSNDPEIARAQVVSRYLKEKAAQGEADSL